MLNMAQDSEMMKKLFLIIFENLHFEITEKESL